MPMTWPAMHVQRGRGQQGLRNILIWVVLPRAMQHECCCVYRVVATAAAVPIARVMCSLLDRCQCEQQQVTKVLLCRCCVLC
jgi:hypothetical protein